MTARRRVWVNKSSGVAHRSLSCPWLEDVPFQALRPANVYEWPPPRMRLCPTCFPPQPRQPR